MERQTSLLGAKHCHASHDSSGVCQGNEGEEESLKLLQA